MCQGRDPARTPGCAPRTGTTAGPDTQPEASAGQKGCEAGGRTLGRCHLYAVTSVLWLLSPPRWPRGLVGNFGVQIPNQVLPCAHADCAWCPGRHARLHCSTKCVHRHCSVQCLCCKHAGVHTQLPARSMHAGRHTHAAPSSTLISTHNHKDPCNARAGMHTHTASCNTHAR